MTRPSSRDSNFDICFELFVRKKQATDGYEIVVGETETIFSSRSSGILTDESESLDKASTSDNKSGEEDVSDDDGPLLMGGVTARVLKG